MTENMLKYDIECQYKIIPYKSVEGYYYARIHVRLARADTPHSQEGSHLDIMHWNEIRHIMGYQNEKLVIKRSELMVKEWVANMQALSHRVAKDMSDRVRKMKEIRLKS